MKRENLNYVLFEQQKEFQENREIIDREIKDKILSFLKLKLPIIITGVRRCGKSTLLYIMKNHLKLKQKDYLYINFNDERLIDFSVEDFQKIMDFLNEQDYNEKCHLFLDEIQETNGWEKWIDRIKEKHPIFITGSNSKLLSKEISTILTGRSINISLHPFSFREFLITRRIETKNWEVDLNVQSKLRQAFSEYISFGGIPKAIVENDKRLLKENYENILYRDIIKRFNQNLEKPIKEISVFLLSNVSNELSIRKLSKMIQIKNLLTLKSILDTFEKAFLFFFISKYDFSIKKQIQNPRKIYCIDNGFVNEVGFRFSEDKGRILENLVFLELKRKEKEIYYFSEKGECDFVLRDKTKIKTAVQVCYDLNEKNKNREINGLIEAMNKFKLKKGFILTYNQDDELTINNKKIIIKPVWQALLSENFF